MRRRGWWGLAGLGLLAAAGAVWTLRAPDPALAARRADPSGVMCGAGECSARQSSADTRSSQEGALATALSVSFLEPGGAAPPRAAATPSTGPEPSAFALGGMRLARASRPSRALPEARGLVFLALAVAAGVGRRRTRRIDRGGPAPAS